MSLYGKYIKKQALQVKIYNIVLKVILKILCLPYFSQK